MLELRFRFHTTGHGTLHCARCGGDRACVRCTGRRWFHLLGVPLIPLDRVGEHVQCRSCRTRYRLEVLSLPTVAQMQAALPAGSLAAVLTMLRAGDQDSDPARRLAIDVVRAAGLTDYDDDGLTADLAAGLRAELAGLDEGPDTAVPLRTLARQLVGPAPEWFLADAIRVGLADGPLSTEERVAAQLIAAHLGLSQARATRVISATEESAAAG